MIQSCGDDAAVAPSPGETRQNDHHAVQPQKDHVRHPLFSPIASTVSLFRAKGSNETEVEQVSEGEVEARQVVISEAQAKHVGESKLEATQFGAMALIAIIYR
jgi:hypothetical protein